MSETSNGQEPQADDSQPTVMMELTELEVRCLLANYASGVAGMVTNRLPLAAILPNFPRIQAFVEALRGLEIARAIHEAERFDALKREQDETMRQQAVLAGAVMDGKPS